jgi:hypothetical protein
MGTTIFSECGPLFLFREILIFRLKEKKMK